jgi:hypothetical protein
MEADELIARLGARLDKWFEGNLETFASDAKERQAEALVGGFALVKELDRLKADGLAAIKAAINPSPMGPPAEHAQSLMRSFIADTLDSIGVGRAVLVALLDNPDPGVRAAAGAKLIRIMPARVVPILREIEAQGGGRSCSFAAHWVLLQWEREGKADANKSP